MRQMRGVTLLDLDVFRDRRGDLVAIDEPSNLPFPLRRVFYMKPTARDARAASCDLFITPVTGAVTLDVDNGETRTSIRLASPAHGVWTRPGITIGARDYSHQTLLLVCASAGVVDTRYFRTARPDLIEAHAYT